MAVLRTRFVAVRSSLTSRWNWAEAKASLVWKYAGGHRKQVYQVVYFRCHCRYFDWLDAISPWSRLCLG
jgi:hypothetical protein